MHKHQITGITRNGKGKIVGAIVQSDWFNCEEHNPNIIMSVDFLFRSIEKHPDWFEVHGEKK